MMEVKQQNQAGCLEKFSNKVDQKSDSVPSSAPLSPEIEDMEKLCYIDSDEDQNSKNSASSSDCKNQKENGLIDENESNINNNKNVEDFISTNGDSDDALINKCCAEIEKKILQESAQELNLNNIEQENILDLDKIPDVPDIKSPNTPTQDENISTEVSSTDIKTKLKDKLLEELNSNESLETNNENDNSGKVVNRTNDAISVVLDEHTNNKEKDSKLTQNESIDSKLDIQNETNNEMKNCSQKKTAMDLDIKKNDITLSPSNTDDLDKLLLEIDEAIDGSHTVVENETKKVLPLQEVEKTKSVLQEDDDDDEIIFIHLKPETNESKIENQVESEDDDLIFFEDIEQNLDMKKPQVLNSSSDIEFIKTDSKENTSNRSNKDEAENSNSDIEFIKTDSKENTSNKSNRDEAENSSSDIEFIKTDSKENTINNSNRNEAEKVKSPEKNTNEMEKNLNIELYNDDKIMQPLNENLKNDTVISDDVEMTALNFEETSQQKLGENLENNSVKNDDNDVVEIPLESPKQTETEISKSIENDECKTVSNESNINLENQSKESTDISKHLDKISSDNSDNARDILAENKDQNVNVSDLAGKEKIDINDENNTNLDTDSPPEKKLRVEAENNTASTSVEEKLPQDDDIVLIDQEASRKSLKRSVSNDNLSNDSAKKPKLDRDEKLKFVAIELEEQKSTIPFELKLYPVPKVVKSSDIKLEFMKKFKHSLQSITKYDLEEYVGQKIIDCILYKNEFGELREIVEKQNTLIEQQRNKLYELSKQLKDMEMVHNRVVRDLESRNQQFIMPVKITRAVGLQVVIPTKLRNLSTSSERLNTPINTAPSTSGLTNNNSKSPAPSTSTAHTPNSLLNQSNVLNPNQKRSHQKFTPLRPDTPQNSPLNRPTTSVSAVLSTNLSQKINAQNSQQQITSQQLLHKQQQQALAQKQLLSVQQKRMLQQQQLNSSGTHLVNKLPIVNSTYSNVRKSTSMISNASQVRVTSQQQQLQASSITRGSINTVRKSTSQIRPVSAQVQPATIGMQKVSPISGTIQKTQKSFIDLTDDEEALNNGIPPLVSLQQQQAPSNTRITYAANKQPGAGNLQRSQANIINRNLPARIPNNVPQNRLPNRGVPVRYIHPAPLPRPPPIISTPTMKELPPQPAIHINNVPSGIVISWTMDDLKETHADVTSYQIYAYQETSAPPQTESWRHVGDVKAMLLPMAVTLTQFQEGQKYFFAVRAVDVHNRCGNFSSPQTWA